MFKEFKKFIAKGNVLELAVGLILATYFGAIVKSLVNDIIMPAVGYLIGGVDFNKLKYVISEAQTETLNDAGEVITAATAEVAIKYGVFINTIIVFFVVTFCVFLVVKAYNNMKERMKKKEEEAPAAPPKPSKEEELLSEIRDLLKK